MCVGHVGIVDPGAELNVRDWKISRNLRCHFSCIQISQEFWANYYNS